MEEEIISRTEVMRENEYLFHCLVTPKKLIPLERKARRVLLIRRVKL